MNKIWTQCTCSQIPYALALMLMVCKRKFVTIVGDIRAQCTKLPLCVQSGHLNLILSHFLQGLHNPFYLYKLTFWPFGSLFNSNKVSLQKAYDAYFLTPHVIFQKPENESLWILFVCVEFLWSKPIKLKLPIKYFQKYLICIKPVLV